MLFFYLSPIWTFGNPNNLLKTIQHVPFSQCFSWSLNPDEYFCLLWTSLVIWTSHSMHFTLLPVCFWFDLCFPKTLRFRTCWFSPWEPINPSAILSSYTPFSEDALHSPWLFLHFLERECYSCFLYLLTTQSLLIQLRADFHLYHSSELLLFHSFPRCSTLYMHGLTHFHLSCNVPTFLYHGTSLAVLKLLVYCKLNRLFLPWTSLVL